MAHFLRKSRPLNRRTFLRGMLGGAAVSVGLPALNVFLNANGTAYASEGAFPVRFGLFFWGNGILPARWVPQLDGEDYALSDQLAPLESIKDVLTVVTGMEIKTPNVEPHRSGAAGILTGHPLLITETGDTAMAPSIDQVVAAELGSATRFRSLEYGAQARGGYSFNGPDNRNPPESNAYALFERIFGAGFREPGDMTEIDPTIALRRSVLDAVSEDVTRFSSRLGAEDQLRLDQHLTGIRDLELRLARLAEGPPDYESCRRADEPLADYPDIEGRPQLAEENRAMCDIVALALACDQTRVVSNFITEPLNNLLFEGTTAGHHQLTHDEPGDQPEVHSIVLQIMDEYRYMVEAFRAIPEGDGTLLDNSVLVGTSDVSSGRTHSFDEFPLLFAGNACGRLRNGFHYRSGGGENTSKFMLSMIRAAGVFAAGWGGEDGYVEDGLGAVEA